MLFCKKYLEILILNTALIDLRVTLQAVRVCRLDKDKDKE